MNIFQRGRIWWYKFYFAGREITESSKSRSKTLATEAEKQRRREMGDGFHNLDNAREQRIRPLKDRFARVRSFRGGRPGGHSMISEKSMLAAVHNSVWTAVKHDRKVSQDVADQHGAHQGAGRYNKQLLRGADKLDELRMLAGQIRQ